MDSTTETLALERVTDRLAERYAPVPRGEIAALVTREAARFADAPLREHVPTLVEHGVREILRPLAPRERMLSHAD